RVREAPPLRRIVIGIDPPGGGRMGAACGIVAAGIAESGTVYVLEDASLEAASPERWAAAAVALFRKHKADACIAEANFGGDMVEAVLRRFDRALPLRLVHASRGKFVRAEPVALLYQQGKVKHVDPPMPALEDELCDFGFDGLSGARSPDRLDALVWAVTALTQAPRAEPRVRFL